MKNHNHIFVLGELTELVVDTRGTLGIRACNMKIAMTDALVREVANKYDWLNDQGVFL